MGDVSAALLLCGIVFAIPFLKVLRKDGRLVIMYWAMLVPYIWIAVTNAYFFTTIGADADAQSFFRNASAIAADGQIRSSFGAGIYEMFLAAAFSTLGTSQFLGELLSIIAFALASLVLVRFSELLGVQRDKITIMLTHAALPTMWMFGAITLRESFQLLFFAVGAYCFVRFHRSRNFRWLVVGILASIGMGILHNGLAAYALGMITLGVLWPSSAGQPRRARWGTWLVVLCIFSVTLSGIIVIGLKGQSSGSAALQMLLKGDALEYAQKYRESTSLGRASYGVKLETGSATGFFASVGLLFLHYLFAPFPWQVRSPIDLYASLEGLWRALLLVSSISFWRKSKGMTHSAAGFLLILYFSIALLWAVGTTNYGTAIRHNMTHYWIIVLLGVSPLLRHVHLWMRLAVLPQEALQHNAVRACPAEKG